jgi:hypothetical protein
MREMTALIRETKSSGVWVFNGGLHPPSTATVVRVRRGETLVTDGPFIEGKEHIGGLLILEAPDLDAALYWARKAAQAVTPKGWRGVEDGLPIEVRPFRGDE